MDITDLLGEELYQLANLLETDHISLIVGGGYGLLLKQRYIEQSNEKTLRDYPSARSTNDLDLFLSIEFVTDAGSMGALKNALYRRGFTSIESAAHYQFERNIEIGDEVRRIKVDLLAPPPQDPDVIKTMKIDSRRIRPRLVKNIHAHDPGGILCC